MAIKTTMKELRKMNLADLTREALLKQALVSKMRLGIKMKKEKDTAKYRREKRQLARMQTVLTELNKAKDTTESPSPISKS